MIWIGAMVCRPLLGASLNEVGAMRFGLLHPTWVDVGGNQWWIHMHIEAVSFEEIERRVAQK